MKRSIPSSWKSVDGRLNDVDPARSAPMARVRGKHSKPELAVGHMAHRLGFRFWPAPGSVDTLLSSDVRCQCTGRIAPFAVSSVPPLHTGGGGA